MWLAVRGVVKQDDHFAGWRIATRQGDEVYYLSGDHLGSVSLTTNSAGNVEAESRYLPYGRTSSVNQVML